MKLETGTRVEVDGMGFGTVQKIEIKSTIRGRFFASALVLIDGDETPWHLDVSDLWVVPKPILLKKGELRGKLADMAQRGIG